MNFAVKSFKIVDKMFHIKVNTNFVFIFLNRNKQGNENMTGGKIYNRKKMLENRWKILYF